MESIFVYESCADVFVNKYWPVCWNGAEVVPFVDIIRFSGYSWWLETHLAISSLHDRFHRRGFRRTLNGTLASGLSFVERCVMYVAREFLRRTLIDCFESRRRVPRSARLRKVSVVFGMKLTVRFYPTYFDIGSVNIYLELSNICLLRKIPNFAVFKIFLLN